MDVVEKDTVVHYVHAACGEERLIAEHDGGGDEGLLVPEHHGLDDMVVVLG